jgi:Ser/Thr protein kinase RdoA (MazF antagonist)
LAAYPLRLERVRIWYAGYNHTYRVTAGGRDYGLRVTRPGPTLADVDSELAWLVDLPETIRAVRPVSTTDGALRVQVQGQVCVLTEWLPGVQRRRSLTPRSTAAVGRLMAQLHDHGAQWSPPPGWSRPTLDTLWGVASAPDLSGLDADMRAVFERAIDALEPVVRAQTPGHVIHADLHQGNVRFTAGHTPWVLDFDDCAVGTPAQDVAISLFYLQRFDHFALLRAGFQQGYSELRAWPDDHVIDQLMLWRVLTMVAGIQAHHDPKLHALMAQRLPTWTAQLRAGLSRAG